ncbi:394_t:CDS:2, partial [Racocetra persica]
MSKRSNYLPSNDQLAALAKGRVPKNTAKNTEGWINIMNQWRSDVNYNELLKNQDKETIELQVSQFLCGITTKQDQPYSRTSLKNALSAINRHLQNVKPGWRYNLHDKNDFSDLYARFDGLLKDMKKKELGKSKSIDGLITKEIRHILNHEIQDPNTPLGLLKWSFFWISILGAARGGEHANLHISQIVDTSDGIILKKAQQKNDQGDIKGNQFDLIIPFPPDPEGITGPNSDIRKYLSLWPKNFKSSNFYLSACHSPDAIVKGKWYLDKPIPDHTIRSMFKMICIECEINIESRNISNYSGQRTSIMELFNVGVSENTGCTISGHKSSGGYYAYAKPTDKHKREALMNVLNKQIIDTPSNELMQDSIKYTNSEPNNSESNNSEPNNSELDNPEPDSNENSLSTRFEDDENSDLNNSVQNEHEFYGIFHMAKEVLKNKSRKRSPISDENKQLLRHKKKVTIVHNHYNN